MTRLLTFVLFISTSSFGQKINSTERSGNKNIYNNAIKHYSTNFAKDEYIKLDTLFFQKNEIITDSLQSINNGTILKFLDWTEIRNKLDNQQSFTLYKLFPLRFDNGEFSVSIVPYSTTKTNDNINLSYGGGCKIIYHFDSKTKEFTFIKVKCWGI